MPELKEVRGKLNRHGRRALVAEARQSPQFEREYKARGESDKHKFAREAGLNTRLDAVRARTKARNGIINNPRFR